MEPADATGRHDADGTARPRPVTRLAAQPPVVEHTHWSWGLIGFYTSCAGVALGATFAASGYLFFESKAWLWFGSVLSFVSCITTYLTLRAARQPASRP